MMNHKPYTAVQQPGINLLASLALTAVLSCFAISSQADATPEELPSAVQPESLKRLLVLDYQLTGDPGGGNFNGVHQQLVKAASAKLREELQRKHLYEVVDATRAAPLIAIFSSGQNLQHCNGCEFDLAKRLDAELVMVPWVFRMSNLVLTMHIEIRDAHSGRTIMKTALDFRGDNEDGWMHAIDYLLKRMTNRRT